MSMNNLKIVVTLLVLIAVVCLGLSVAFKSDPIPKQESSEVADEVIETPVPIYQSNGGEK